MLRLRKYMKPYLGMLLLAIALLFLQANADLALPDYMSRIVNTGIQQGGIEHAVPMVLRSGQMDKLLLFMSEDESNRIMSVYTLTDVDSPGIQETYPKVAGEQIYVLKDLPDEDIEQLDPLMARGMIVVGSIENMATGQGTAMPGGPGFDVSSLPEGTSPFDLIGTLPPGQRDMMVSAITGKFSSMGPGMLVQAATGFVKSEYTALGMDTGKIQNQFIIHTGINMLLLTLVAAISTILVGFISARIAAGLSRDLRSAVFRRVESFSNREFDTFSTASLITRSTNDIMQIQMVTVMLVRMVFFAPIIGVGGIIRAIGKSSSMWWIIAAAVGTLCLLVFIVYKIAIPKFKSMQKLIDRLNLVSREGLAGMLVIRAFNMQQHEEERFDRANTDLTGTTLFINRVMVVMMPVMMFIMNGLSVLIIWVGAHQIAQSSMQVGDMMAFLQYTMQIVFAFLMLSMMFIMLPRASVSAGRIADVLETDPTILDPETPEPFDGSMEGTVEFDHVSFRYPGAEADVLHDISFTARPGQTTAIIGSTGSGKSTIVNLVPRFYDVTGGTIRVAGTDIRRVAQGELRDRIGYVPQKATLFSGTLDTNLRYADENASEDSIRTATAVAQADEFINSQEKGLEAEVSQGGANFSGGQKQRLAIARALVKQPPVYLFDDSFSALDFKTDSNLRRALKEKTSGSTIIIVTQRVATVKNAEQILVLDDGRIVGKGTHQELMDECPTYREIAMSQLSMEELS